MSATALRRALKPHFVWRPSQVVRRLAAERRGPGPRTERLPWGLPLRYDAGDAIGSSIARTGVYELCATEAILRLVDDGELTVDVGANIGYLSSAMAAAVGPSGRVVAFEPHPALRATLAENAAAWRTRPRCGAVDVRAEALSSRSGRATLREPRGFADNRGVATLEEVQPDAAGPGLEVETTTLDDVVGGERVALLKIDVEGHEAAVLAGGRASLAAGRIRDVLFEALGGLPSPASDELERHGYTLLAVRERLAGPRLAPPTADAERWMAPTFLATLDPERARARIGGLGWRALRPRWSW
jgi:FkbM family methyltransferase